jgi:16S rRNA (cytosine967-C5)-methyltransferase
MNRRPRRLSQSVSIPGVDAPSALAGATASGGRAATLAATVVRWSNRESPADQVLRAELKKARGLDAATGALTARMVFCYYRWFGWLQVDTGSMEARVQRALELQDQFNQDPASISENDLADKAVPPWTRSQVADGPTYLAWLRCLQREPVIWLRARPGTGQELLQQLNGTSLGPLPDSIEYSGFNDLYVYAGFQNGDLEIQDLASQAVGHACAPNPGETWWDACAGEGGKTLHLSALMKNQGLIWASDRANWRLTRLKQRAARARVFNYRAAAWDGGARLPTKTVFHGVLMDAPCSGLGTWQRNPHARWTLTPADIEELATIQNSLLEHAAKSLKPRGRLIYSVCTLTRAETTGVVETFNRHHPELVCHPPTLPELPATSVPGSGLWLWPQDIRANGMFISCWQRKGA